MAMLDGSAGVVGVNGPIAFPVGSCQYTVAPGENPMPKIVTGRLPSIPGTGDGEIPVTTGVLAVFD